MNLETIYPMPASGSERSFHRDVHYMNLPEVEAQINALLHRLAHESGDSLESKIRCSWLRERVEILRTHKTHLTRGAA